MNARSYCLTSASTRARVSHGGLGSRPEKNMLYSASSRFISASSRIKSRSTVPGSATSVVHVPGDQKPHQRQPQLARERHRPIVDEHVRGVRAAHDVEQVAEGNGIAGPETGAVSK